MHFRMILHRPYTLVRIGISSILHLLCRCYGMKTLRQLCNSIPVTHPHLRIFLEALEQRIVSLKVLQVSTSILATASRFHLSPKSIGHQLGAITNAQYRIFADKLRQVHLERIFVIDRKRRSTQDNTYYIIIFFREFVVRQYFAERIHLTYPTPYQLSCLRAKIKNNNLLLHHLVVFC